MRYAYLGVRVGDLKNLQEDEKSKLPAGAPAQGALVSEVTPGGPASKAGLRPRDIITKIDARPVEGSYDVVDYVSSKPVGAKVTVAYVRDGRPATMQVTLDEYPRSGDLAAGGGVETDAVGVHLQDLTPDISRFFRLPDGTRGAIITDVEPNSRAAKAGLAAEDVILEVNRKPVGSAAEAASALRAKPGETLMLKVRRGTATRMVTVPAK